MNCPNCNNEILLMRENHIHCESCGWFRYVDGKWITCPEPVKPVEPKPIEPVPAEPVRDNQPVEPDVKEQLGSKTSNADRHITSYLGGLVTITETNEVEDETDD